jgi:hypothetical protein
MELQPIQTEQSIQVNLKRVNDTLLVLLLFQMEPCITAFFENGHLKGAKQHCSKFPIA